jgi:hypothetical protein
MHTLNEKSRGAIKRITGFDVDYIANHLTLDDEILEVKKITGNKIAFSRKTRPWNIGRGNPLVARRKIKTKEEIEKILAAF